MDDLDKLVDSLKDAINYLEDNSKLLNDLGSTVEDKVKQNTPVDTGTLRDSITHKVQGNEVIIDSDCEYAQYVENGHSTGDSFIKGKHMFTKGYDESNPVIDAKINKFIDNIPLFKK